MINSDDVTGENSNTHPKWSYISDHSYRKLLIDN